MRYEVLTSNPYRRKVDRCLLDEVILDAVLEGPPGPQQVPAIAMWFSCPTVLVVATVQDVPNLVEPILYHNVDTESISDMVDLLVYRLVRKDFTVIEETEFNMNWIPEDKKES